MPNYYVVSEQTLSSSYFAHQPPAAFPPPGRLLKCKCGFSPTRAPCIVLLISLLLLASSLGVLS